jgi:hypothetical protein
MSYILWFEKDRGLIARRELDRFIQNDSAVRYGIVIQLS